MSTPAPAFIPRETLSAYQRWELASFAPGDSAPGRGNGAGDAAQQRADDLTQLRAAAMQEGRAAGYREGWGAAGAEVARLATLLTSLGDAVNDHEQQLADGVLDLALTLTRRLVGEALSVRRDLLLPVISGALAQLPELTQRVRLHLDPADVELVRSLMEGHPGVATCQLVPDATVGCGGFRLETEQCDVDATLAARWQRLAGSLGRSYEWLDHT